MGASTQWRLWSTEARLVVDREAALETALNIAQDELDRIGATVDRFRPESELSRVAGRQHDGVEVSDLLGEFVTRALDAARLTDGLVDPALGRSMAAIGYDRDIDLILDDDRPVRAIVATRPGWRGIRLQGGTLTVPAHLALDLGATAKAHAADRVAAVIARETGAAVLLSLGGDIATAGREPADGWNVTVQDGPGQPKTTVRLAAGWAMATSSTLRRSWLRDGERMHHIIDPRDGLPAWPVWRTVSVAAPTCLEANAYATAAIIRGRSAPDWLDGRVAARLVGADGEVVTVGDWPAEPAASASFEEVHRG